MPASRRGEWEHLLAIEGFREKRSKLEDYLDRGVGACHLRDPGIARLCEEALLFFHDQRYELLAWCVMPNHVHVLVHVWQTPLGKMMQSWKRHTATQAEAWLLERRSPTRRVSADEADVPARRAALQSLRWEREYWDTFMRDEAQERKAVHYIEANPVKARLVRSVAEWPFSSARFRDHYAHLIALPRINDMQSAQEQSEHHSA